MRAVDHAVETLMTGGDVDPGTRKLVIETSRTTLQGDGPKLERVVENLVMNAIRHTPADATIWVRCEPTPEGGRLVVEDDGPGIADGLKRTLFEPFFQGPDSGRRANPGTGIGLSLVARLTELHGGVARIEDRDGGGARFVVDLPADGGASLSASGVGSMEPADSTRGVV